MTSSTSLYKARARLGMAGSSALSPICLLGGGEHAKVVADLLMLDGRKLEGYWGPPVEAQGIRYLGGDQALKSEWATRWGQHAFHLALVGKAGSGLRRRVLEGVADLPLFWATLIHPTAFVSPSAVLQAGCFVGPGAIIHAHARVGAHVIVNSGAIVEHDVIIGSGSHLAPASVVGGGTRIGSWTTIGLGSCLRDHIRIGDGAVVAMGAVVTEDVQDGAWVAGIPARPMKRNPQDG